MLELLAPVGDAACFAAAINCGADAVYLGLSDFNARRKAENFSADTLRPYIEKAHFFGVKVYVTVNTLVKDEEFSSLLSLVKAAVEAKADAFIVQDIGAAAVLRECFPGIILHASTQLGIHNLYGALQAQKLGFRRAVLSRETKLEDIRRIRKGTDLEIEYFVQGALCVAFSGNCYLSAVEQNASGNRGLCKQLCRLPYIAKNDGYTKSGYLLSAKDICLADSLQELAEAGVTSFKIEGRMRREGYVASAVSVYRKLLDGIVDDAVVCGDNKMRQYADIGGKGKAQEGATQCGAKLSRTDREKLKIAYCRGDGYLERAYLDEGTPFVTDSCYGNHTGLRIGDVREVRPFKGDLYKVRLYSSYPLNGGDGLKFFEDGSVGDVREVASIGIGDMRLCDKNTYEFVTKTKLCKDWHAHLISSRAADGALKEWRRFADIDIKVNAVAGKPLSISANCGVCGETVTELGDICEKAINSPISIDELTNQACKVADSGFRVNSCDVKTDGVFVPKSILNALRRRVLEKLKKEMITRREENCAEADYKTIEKICKEKAECKDIVKLRFAHSGCEDDISDFGGKIVLCPSEYKAEEIKRMLISLGVNISSVALQLPVIANGKDIAVIEKLLAELPSLRTLVSENLYGLKFIDDGYEVIAGAGHNVFNRYAVREYKRLGAAAVLPSLESGKRVGIEGCELPLMTFAHCPYKTVFGNDCAHCSYRQGMEFARDSHRYTVRRTRVAQCYFGLYPK